MQRNFAGYKYNVQEFCRLQMNFAVWSADVPEFRRLVKKFLVNPETRDSRKVGREDKTIL